MLNLLVGGTMLLSASQVAISGDTDCPTPADIRRYLVPLLPDTRDAAAPDRVVLEMGSENELQVILTSVEGVVLKKRAIPRSSTCDHLAETVAVLIASWETELHPGWSPIIEPPSERPNAPPSNTNNGLAAWTTIGTSLSDAAGSIAPAVSLGFALGPRRGRWTARLSAIGVAAHKATLGPGEISWKRLSAAAGIGTTVGSGPIDLDIEVAGVGGAIVVTGHGFSSNQTVVRPDVGLSLGARLNWHLGNVAPWAGVGLDIWPLGQEARVAGWPDGRPLPRVEPRIGIGITALIWQ
jgi:hypothetical protein